MSEELRERMAKLAIEDLREATDNLYVYNFLKDMANIVIADEGFRVHTDYYGDTVWIDENEYYGDHEEVSELDRLTEALEDHLDKMSVPLEDLEAPQEETNDPLLDALQEIFGSDVEIKVVESKGEIFGDYEDETEEDTELEDLEEKLKNLQKTLDAKIADFEDMEDEEDVLIPSDVDEFIDNRIEELAELLKKMLG